MTRHTLSDEKNLLRRLQQGDEAALNELMGAYKRPLGRNMVRILKSTELAEDALQELFLNVWLHRERINPELPVKAYLFGIARNLVNEALRKSAREEHMLENYQRFRTACYTHVEESLMATENRELLDQALDRLPEQQRQVFTLCKLEGKSYREAGRILSLSPATINVHLSRANASIRQYFRDHPDLFTVLVAGSLLLGL